jgi:hypothetical protein
MNFQLYERFEKCLILHNTEEGENFNQRHTFKYSEDYNLSLTMGLGKRRHLSKGSERGML